MQLRATAEAEVLEAAVQSQIDQQSNGHDLDLPPLESSIRTERYVMVMAHTKLVESGANVKQEPPSFDNPLANIVDLGSLIYQPSRLWITTRNKNSF